MEINKILEQAVEKNYLPYAWKEYIDSEKEIYEQLIVEYYEEYGSLKDFMYILNAIYQNDEKAKLIRLIRNDIEEDWAVSDLLYYCVADLDYENMYWLRLAGLNNLQYNQRCWLLSMNSRSFDGRSLLKVSLHGLAIGMAFEMIYCFWEYKDFDLTLPENTKIFRSFLKKNLNKAGALYLTYYAIMYSNKEVDILYKLNMNDLDVEESEKIMLNRRNRTTKSFVDSMICGKTS